MQHWRLADNRLHTRLADADAARRWQGPFCFAQLADTQLGFDGTNVSYPRDIEHAEQAVRHLNRLRPRFAIVCGDLVNYIPELYPDQPAQLYARQVADFKRMFDDLHQDVPLVCVCGNHDVGNQPNVTTLARWQSEFGDDYFAFHVEGVTGIVLNTNLVSDPSAAAARYEAQMQWLAATAAGARAARHVLFFGHHPLFLSHARETANDDALGEDVFSDPRSGREIRIPHSYFHLPLERRLPLLEIMRDCGARWFFAGHFHRNCIAHDDEFGITCVTTSAVGKQLGNDDHGFRLVRVGAERLEHRYFALSAMPDSLSAAFT